MKKIKINITQISDKNSVQNVSFNKIVVNGGSENESIDYQNVNLSNLIHYLNGEDKVIIKITSKKINKNEKVNKGEN